MLEPEDLPEQIPESSETSETSTLQPFTYDIDEIFDDFAEDTNSIGFGDK